MNYSGEEVVSWLQSHGFSPETLERIGKRKKFALQHILLQFYVHKLHSFTDLCSYLILQKRTVWTVKISSALSNM